MPAPKQDVIDVTPKKGQWHVYPRQLPGGVFRAFEDREDISHLRGAWVLGQNFKFRKAGLPTLREGAEVIGTASGDALPVNRAWIFETRGGVKFELKAYSTLIKVRIIDVTGNTFYTLLTGLTTGLDFGYANIGESGGEFHSFFNNGTDSFYQFNGAYATVLSITGTTVTMSESGTFTTRGFYSTGTRSITVNGVQYPYTGGEGTATLTGITDTTGISVGDIIFQSPRVVSALANFKSNVIMAHDGRIHLALASAPSTWCYSNLDNPDDFSGTAANDGEGDSKDIEFSGGIKAFGKLNNTILGFKERIIKYLDFIQSGTRLDVPYWRTLIPADDKSTTLGAINQKSTIATPYGCVFITPDKRLILLTGITQNNQPQYLVLSDPIQPIFDAGVFDDASCICVNNVLKISYKASSASASNDTVLYGDMSRQSADRVGRVLPIQWDTPNVGWGVKDWTAVNEGGEVETHWHSSTSSDSHRELDDNKSDDGSGFTATLRSWAEDFGLSHLRKKVDLAWVDIRMKESSEFTITHLYDENGYTFVQETDIAGTETTKRYSAPEYNPFGASAFGTQKFGSNPENDALSIYRFPIELNPNKWFYNISMQISGDVAGNDCELIGFGYRLFDVEETIPRTIKK